ncbi:MAG: RNA methyltransferase [Sulfurisoma sp.]|nr:RNA methyltransferase [Sulfurisoma sp.]
MNTPQPLASALSRIRVVLSRTSHPGNIGAAARAMKTMGLSRLVLVAPRYFPDPRAEAMAAGATDVLESARVCATLEEALAGTVFATAMTARRRELATEPLWVREAMAETAAQLARDASGEVAIVFGNETSGLSNDELALCPRWAMIPCNPEWTSLNLAAAVQIACYELRLAKVGAGDTPLVADASDRATLDEIAGLIGHLESAATAAGFLDPASPKRLMHRLRRLFARAALEKVEVNILRGLIASLLDSRNSRSPK